MSIDFCPFENTFEVPYTELAISVILFMILQILLLYHTLHFEYKNCKKKGAITGTKFSIRTTFIALQLVGFYFTFNEFLRFIIDPYLQFIQTSAFSCTWIAYSPKIITIIYFAIYLLSVLLRLELSFRDSHLALSKKSTITLGIVILIPCTFVTITYFLFVDEPCIWPWQPPDITVNADFAFCDFHTEGVASAAIGLGIMWVVVVNVIYGIIFGVKLKNVFRHSKESDVHTSFKLKSLIIKNTILTSIGSISTLFNWFMWLIHASGFIGIGTCFLYFDVWFNCFIIALMFKYNERHYKRLCKVCIICCLMDCDKTYDKKNKLEHEKQLKRTNKYLRHQTQHSEVFASKTDVSTVGSTTNNNVSVQSPPDLKSIELEINHDIEPVGSISADVSIPDTY